MQVLKNFLEDLQVLKNFLEDVQVLARLGHHLLVGLQAHFQQRRPAVGHSKDAILLHHHYHYNHHHHHNGYHMT